MEKWDKVITITYYIPWNLGENPQHLPKGRANLGGEGENVDYSL